MKKDDYIKTLTTPIMECDIFLGVTPSPQCAVKVLSTGKHCPEVGIHKSIDSDEYLCERCYDNYKHRNNNQMSTL